MGQDQMEMGLGWGGVGQAQGQARASGGLGQHMGGIQGSLPLPGMVQGKTECSFTVKQMQFQGGAILARGETA